MATIHLRDKPQSEDYAALASVRLASRTLSDWRSLLDREGSCLCGGVNGTTGMFVRTFHNLFVVYRLST